MFDSLVLLRCIQDGTVYSVVSFDDARLESVAGDPGLGPGSTHPSPKRSIIISRCYSTSYYFLLLRLSLEIRLIFSLQKYFHIIDGRSIYEIRIRTMFWRVNFEKNVRGETQALRVVDERGKMKFHGMETREGNRERSFRGG